jgi:serine/threonine protein kinase
MSQSDPASFDETVLAGDPSRNAEYIGRYLIEGILGEGAMGVVYKGFDTSIKRHVAIKTIHGALLLKDDGDEFLARFSREAQAAGRLVHPNVVTVFEFGNHEDTPYLVLEFIPGRELKEIIDEGNLDIASARDIFVQILAGLGVAHDAGIVHRDIKPQNIFVMPNGLTKVGDFGIARIDATGLTRTGMILGTPSYMSPEQFTGGELDHRSDLYAAAALLHEMLTGAKVFTGKTITEVMYAVLEKEPTSADTLVSTVSASVAAVVSKGLAKRPEDRFQSAEEFRVAFVAACAESSMDVAKSTGPRTWFTSSPALTSEALRGADVGIGDHQEVMQMLINRRTRGALAPGAGDLLQKVALSTLTYDDLVQFLKGLGQEGDPRLSTYTLATELSKRSYEKTEGTRLESSVRNLAHSATQTKGLEPQP